VTTRLGQGDTREYGRLLHDVTDERRTAEAVLQAQKLESIGVLAGGVAHDFNNLLASILGNVSLAMADLPAGNSARQFLEIAERSSLKAAALIAQLLAYAGKGHVVITRFDLSESISEILPLIETSIPKTVSTGALAESRPAMDRSRSDRDPADYYEPRDQWRRGFGPEGGSVLVSTGAAELDARQNQPDGVYLEVRDSGCGMDEVTKSRMFDPFFTTKFTGRGLGLAAVSVLCGG